jgi:signal peptidase I
VTVRSLKLFRDIYYTRSDTSDHTRADLIYVQPGHYLCLGDNSASSSDSREWGLVPERLMLGKAVFVFFPWGRLGFIK